MSAEAARFSLADINDVLWTLTNRCNLTCVYCTVVPHGGEKPEEPSAKEIDRIIDQLSVLPNLDSLILSGGEALISRHLEPVLARTRSIARSRYVITNGTTLNQANRLIMLRHRPRVMVSIDSLDERQNAFTRGPGVLAKALETVRWLLDNDFFTVVIIVFTRYNAPTIERTISGLYEIGVRKVLIQQLHCSSRSLRGFFRSASPALADFSRLAPFVDSFRAQHSDAIIDDNEVCFFEKRPAAALAKCVPGKEYLPQRLFQCGAAFKFFAIKANGDVIPCNALLECVAGNVHRQRLAEILLSSAEMNGLRQLRMHRVNVIPGCAECPVNAICDGGCRADVFNLTGEIGNAHPYCAVNITNISPRATR